ncbi:HER147Wp [Eremothecium sinecaudum]|uniref:HER147Wp n=1 Tax=Eremothecium sinecaudum TaxID=45286 RepID=A0A0X8HU06_9SACH|nr:HER147Wp [Eremothecium sinecaudum]AMD21426.1 HER147Wp [Eremothecium sinecaudum]
MVCCDGENCQLEWFHQPCINLKILLKENGTVMIARGNYRKSSGGQRYFRPRCYLCKCG